MTCKTVEADSGVFTLGMAVAPGELFSTCPPYEAGTTIG